MEQYRRIAKEFAEKWSKDSDSLRTFVGCDPSVAGEVACKRHVFDALLPLAFRRPLSPEDVAEFEEVFALGEELGGDFASGARAVLEVLLQSPEFLYRVEVGEPAESQASDFVALTSYEVATRLSYFLWGSAPDAQLFSAAEQGALKNVADTETQARRLLGDARASEVIRRFYERLLDIREAPLELSPDIPELTAGVASDILEQTALFVKDVTWQGPGTFRALMTQPSSWVNPALASFYGIPGVSGEGFRKVDLDPTRGGGILVQPGVMSNGNSRSHTHAPRRGVLILERLLCVELPLPPPDFSDPEPTDPALLALMTTRERFEDYTKGSECMTCHLDMNPAHFAFEHYDAVGRYVDIDNDKPIDSSGELLGTDARGKFSGAAELVQNIAESEDARRCFVGNWLGFAQGREATPDDVCSRQYLESTFAETDGNVIELLVALTQTDNFRYRRKSEVTP